MIRRNLGLTTARKERPEPDPQRDVADVAYRDTRNRARCRCYTSRGTRPLLEASYERGRADAAAGASTQDR